jgi:excisionase family DNA binding protein
MDKRFNISSPWLSVKTGAVYLGYSERHLRRIISTGKLKSYKIPTGGIRIHRSDLDAFIMFKKPFNKLTRPQKELIN